MVFSVPILKHQTFFLQESTQNERIQLVPIDLGILCHIVLLLLIIVLLLPLLHLLLLHLLHLLLLHLLRPRLWVMEA